MKHGLYLPNQADFADARLLASMAQEAEANGWDGLFIWDALLPIWEHSREVREAMGTSRDVADAFTALTAIALSTERIRFGALVTAVPRLRPEAFASQTATIDRLSGGRLIVGVGIGAPDEQFTAFGLGSDARTRAAQMDEFLELLALLWSGREVTHAGVHFTASGVTMTPPAQTPRIPVWIGGSQFARAPRRRAARWDGFAPASDGWPDEVISVAEVEAMLADIRSERQVGSGYDVVLIGSADGIVPRSADLPAYRAAGVTWLLTQALTVENAWSTIREAPPM